MKQTVTSKYEPKSKNVTWIDMSSGSPVLKNYINGRWMPTGGSGGGAGSSNPTEADVTKVWQVTPVQKGTKTEEIVIVPEQTLVDGQELEYNDKFVPGAQCVAVINGVEYRGEVVEDEDLYIFEGEFGGFEYNYEAEEFGFFNETEFPEVTAKLSVIEETTTYDYNWAPGVKIPIPTAEDEGKILVVTKVEDKENSKEYELAPKQTVTIEESVLLQNTSNLDKFVEGATVALVIGGTTCTGQVISEDDLEGRQILYAEIDSGNTTWYLDLMEILGETELAFSGNTGTYEVYVSVLEKEYSYEYQLQSGGNSNGLSIPAFHWENGDASVHYDTLPKVNDIIYFAYLTEESTTRLFPIVVTSINEDDGLVTGTFMPFGNCYNIVGSSSLSKVEIPLGNTTFGIGNWQVRIEPDLEIGYRVYYNEGGVG